jgi:hypothetical protein
MSTSKFHWGWRIGIVYTAFALATLGFVGFALTQEVDLVRTDYYEHSLQHDATMSARSNAKQLGASAAISMENGQIVVMVPETHVAGLNGTVLLYRATTTQHDRTFALKPDGQGRMQISTKGLERGKWTVTVQWTDGTKKFELVSPVEIV